MWIVILFLFQKITSFAWVNIKLLTCTTKLPKEVVVVAILLMLLIKNDSHVKKGVIVCQVLRYTEISFTVQLQCKRYFGMSQYSTLSYCPLKRKKRFAKMSPTSFSINRHCRFFSKNRKSRSFENREHKIEYCFQLIL